MDYLGGQVAFYAVSPVAEERAGKVRRRAMRMRMRMRMRDDDDAPGGDGGQGKGRNAAVTTMMMTAAMEELDRRLRYGPGGN
jgi:hypothetical protein